MKTYCITYLKKNHEPGITIINAKSIEDAKRIFRQTGEIDCLWSFETTEIDTKTEGITLTI